MSAKVVVLYLCFLLKKDIVQGLTWNVNLPLGVSICSDETTSKLYLNWTFTPDTPLPALIEWSLDDGSGTNKGIASLVGTTFTPNAPYAGRVTRAGSTAEIVIQGPFTAADVGIYKVVVTPNTGSSLSADETVKQTNVTKEPIKVSGKEESIFDFTVTCTLGIETNLTLQLWNGDSLLKSDTASASGITTTIPNSSGLTIKCSVTGQGSDCRTSNNKDEKLPVSSFVPASIGVVIVIIIIQLVLVLLVFLVFHENKILWIAAIICGFILVVITIIFIILKSVKCSGASSEGIFIVAVFISVTGLIFGIAVVVLLFKKMGGGPSQPKEPMQEHRDCAKQPKKTQLHQSVRKHNVDNRLPPERHNTEDIKSTAVPLQLSKARSANSPSPLPPRRLPPLNTTLVDTDTSTRKSKEETNEVSVQA